MMDGFMSIDQRPRGSLGRLVSRNSSPRTYLEGALRDFLAERAYTQQDRRHTFAIVYFILIFISSR